ncbi:MAG: histidine kinase [Streptosporangiales bacterium]|nr:histidine kinase [Streptosporangiales bacterium]
MPRTWASGRLRVLRGWRRACDTAVWDRWLAVALAALAFVPALSAVSAELGDLPARPGGVLAVVLMLAQTLPLALRSRRPAVCLTVVGLSFAAYEALGYPAQFGSVTVYIALYSAGAHQPRFRRATALAATAAYSGLATAVRLLGSPDGPAVFLVFYLSLAACWVLGSVVRRQRAEETERRRLAAAAATAAERARIARELHDVVTHHVTAMVVQSGAAQYTAGSPDQVVTALQSIGDTGRRALTELRSLLDVLDPATETAREAAAGTVRDLVEQARTGGQPVELIAFGAPGLAADVDLAVYRVVQEGLTNAVKYAAGQPTVVRVGYRDGRAEVEVTNIPASVPLPVSARRALSGGRGLTGLSERIGTLGGELTAGPEPDGRFRLRAVIPAGGEGGS